MKGKKEAHLLKIYSFTLILKDVDENTPELEDGLYESGCDDSLINFRAGAVYLDFDREATSLEEAVLSAIKDVESASVKPTVINVAPEDLVTEAEIAKRMNMKRQAVSLWIKGQRRKSILFPKPVMKVSDKSPFWKWSEITEWLYHHQLIDKIIMDEAMFIEDINAVLQQRDAKKLKYRKSLLKKLENMSEARIKIPNKKTTAAIEDVQSGKTHKAKSVAELFEDLD